MLNPGAPLKLISLVIICALCYGCKTIPQTSGGGGSPSGPSTETSSGSSGSSSSLPSGGGRNPSPSLPSSQSGGQEKTGTNKSYDKQGGAEKTSRTEAGDASKRKDNNRSKGPVAGTDDTEERTLSEALEEFERARKSQQGKGTAEEQTDFPIILESENEVVGDAIEKMEGVEGAAGDNPGGSQGAPNSAQTGEEKIAILDRKLEESYGDFEGVILREREYVRGKENARGSGEDVDGDLEEKQTPGERQGEPRGEITGAGAGSRPEGGDQRAGEFEHAAVSHAPPPDIPDGTDDDVVARQLREAAIQEPDPELREKLWDEYRKYKNQGKSK